MDILLDDPVIEQEFQALLRKIRLYKNGEVSVSMKEKGITYRINWGVSIMDLRNIAKEHIPSHLLALKLWNKQWRETMILATLLDEPKLVSEQQMDFWTKSFENSEIAEQASANLWWKSPPAYVKALEWCRGKKHWVRYTAVHLIGRLAMSDKKSPDEMFEPFFEELVPLSRDMALSVVLERTLIILANRSESLSQMINEFIEVLKNSDSEVSKELASNLDQAINF
ncbi:DNA alkylation repair enzyme [Bacteroidales bacterium 6E]|nr:DNA alkylation repair enzyme [Bacteroidales bacterium 6E]